MFISLILTKQLHYVYSIIDSKRYKTFPLLIDYLQSLFLPYIGRYSIHMSTIASTYMNVEYKKERYHFHANLRKYQFAEEL